LRWTLAKRKHIADKCDGQPPPTAHLTLSEAIFYVDDDISVADGDKMEDEYDDTAVNVPFAFVAFTWFTTSLADLSDYWVINYAYSVNLTAFRSDFTDFHTHLLDSVQSVVSVLL
jgi:hypothetical protein